MGQYLRMGEFYKTNESTCVPVSVRQPCVSLLLYFRVNYQRKEAKLTPQHIVKYVVDILQSNI